MPEIVIDGDLVLYGFVGDDWEGFTARSVLEALPELDQAELLVRLNSYGGIAAEGVAIFNALKLYPGKVVVQIEGMAASAASVVAMAGDEIRMLPGSLMMIHDPSNLTYGTAEEHRNAADHLDYMADTWARIYAARTGKPEKEIRDMMKATTWMNGEDAVAAGFATEAVSDEDTEAAAPVVFNYSTYQNAPENLLVLTRNWQAEGVPMNAAMCAADLQKRTMEMPNTNSPAPSAPQTPETVTQATVAVPAVPDAATLDAARLEAQTAERTRVSGIYQAVRAARMESGFAEELIGSGVTLAEANAKIIDKMAEMNATDETVNAVPGRVTLDGVDKFCEGVEKALLAKAGMEGGERNEYASMSLMEMGRASLNVRNLQPRAATRLEMAGMIFVPTMAGGMHGTSDFGNVLANVANKAMLKGFAEAEETFQLWTMPGTLSDFKTTKRVGLGAFPSLAEVPAGGEYTYGTIGDHGEEITLATYGKMFSITRQAIINDDLASFTRIPMKMGRAAIRTVGNLVWAVITSNPVMADGTALFHADHKNLAGSGAAPSGATINAGITAMAKQTDRDENSVASNIAPKFGLFPYALRETVLQVLNSEYDPSKSTRAANTVRGIIEPIMDARLDTASATAWYLAADPNMTDTVEVAYLDGQQAPTLEQRDGWSIDGTEFKVRMDAAVKALAFEGLYKNAGA